MTTARDVLSHARILIADDEEINLRPIKRILEIAGALNVRTTSDPHKVLPIFLEFRPDIVLLDLHMPGIDGFAVMRQLNEVVPAGTFLPILILTADLAVESKRAALTAGAKDFLTKPLDATEIILRITHLLEMRFWHLQAKSENVLLEEQVRLRTEQLEETLTRLHATQAHVIKQERLSALGVMASGIAHDFNNSLAAILGYGELLQTRPGEPRYLQNILTAADNARQTVHRLREFSRVREKTDEHRATSLNQAVKEAVELTQPRWSNQSSSKGIEVRVELDLGDVPSIDGSASQLREMLVNLIFNAVDALPAGGTIRVKTFPEEDGVILQVSDDGTGMNEQTREKCLEPFFTTKGDAGTGLGLSVVYGILQRHGATLDVRSEPRMGSTFRIRFPIGASARLSEGEDAEAGGPERSLRILAVDDQPIIGELVGELLTSAGHVVDIASGGGVALEKCREQSYDLVVTDEAMPGMKGQQLAAVIKQLTPDKPVILLTGFGDTVRENGCTPSVDAILDKPATLQELRKAIAFVTKPPAERAA